jgi:hypothetical protein
MSGAVGNLPVKGFPAPDYNGGSYISGDGTYSTYVSPTG